MKYMSQKLAAALGMFDGLHTGHRQVIQTAVDNGLGYIPAVVSFKQHPRQLLGCQSPGLLTDLAAKKALLAQLGVRKLILLDFKPIKDLAPAQFLNYLTKTYNIGMLICGYNFRFGKNGAGSAEDLYKFGRQNSIQIKVVPAVELDSHTVSSTLIRNLIKSGQIERANKMLGRSFSFCSPVLKGDGRGRKLGFATINQTLPKDFIVPKPGVYITTTYTEGKTLPSVSNIGFRPTFGSDCIVCETHIINFSGNLYGKMAEIQLISFLRQEQKFKKISHLTAQVKRDITAAQNFFNIQKI